MKFKTMRLASLVLLLIILSTGLVSALISVNSISGSYGITGYRASNDSIGINVSSTSNVSVAGLTSAKCVSTGVLDYVCVFKDTIDTSVAYYQLINLDGQTATTSINVDNSIGEITYTVKTANNIVSINYSVTDSGFSGNNACSGIKTINIYDGKNKLNTFNINSEAGVCSYSGINNISITSSGTKSISLEVIDNVGNKKQTPSENMTFDLTSPVIVNGLMVKYSGTNDEIGTVSSSASFLVDLYFSIREDSLETINLNLINSNNDFSMQQAYSNINVPISNCEINDSSKDKVYSCVLRGVQLSTINTDNYIKVNVSAIDTYGNYGSAILSKSLTIDDLEPKVSIKTSKCSTTNVCYIKNGVNNIILNLNKNNFNKRYVFFKLPGATFETIKVQNCSASICSATVPLTCTSGSQVTISITDFSGFDSQDDAGNVLTPFNTQVYCDNVAPIVNGITVTGDATSVIKEFVSGSTITLIANVTEVDSDELLALVYLDKIKNSTEKGTCTKTDSYNFNCIWTITNINDGYYDANLVFNVTDIAGNSAPKSYVVKVLGKKSDNDTPDNLGIDLIKVTPNEINRIVLDMATAEKLPYYIYATYKLNLAKPNAIGVEALYQSISLNNCVYSSKSGVTSASSVFNSITLANSYAKIGETGRVDLKFRDGLTDLVNNLDDKFVISCNISVMEKENNKIYQKPQMLQLDMEFTLINSKLCKTAGQDCTPGAKFGEKINDVQNNWMVRSQVMATIDNWIPKLQSMCKVKDYLAVGTFASNAASVALDLVKPSLAVGPMKLNVQLTNLETCLMGTSKSSATSGNPLEQLMGTANGESKNPEKLYSQCQGIIGQMCSALTCDVASKFEDKKSTLFPGDGTSSNSGKIPDFFAKDSSFGSEVGSALTKNVNVPDVSNSIVMAATTGCLPAVYYNVNKFRQVECNYLYCLKMASYSGTDISACDKAKSAQQCVMVVGEAFEIIPIARELKNVMNNAADLVRNSFPLAVASGLKRAFCPEYLDFNTGSVGSMGKLNTDDKTGLLSGDKSFADMNPAKQKRMIYGCQIPLQIARFADSTSRSSNAGKFVYPVMPDMCKYATCVGDTNCAYTPDFFDTLSKINPQLSKADSFGNNKDIAQMNKDIASLKKLQSLDSSKVRAATNNVVSTDATDAALRADLLSRGIINADYTNAKTPQEKSKYLTEQINFYQNKQKLYSGCIAKGSNNCDAYKNIDKNEIISGIDTITLKTTPDDYNNKLSAQERLNVDNEKLKAVTKIEDLTTSMATLDKQIKTLSDAEKKSVPAGSKTVVKDKDGNIVSTTETTINPAVTSSSQRLIDLQNQRAAAEKDFIALSTDLGLNPNYDKILANKKMIDDYNSQINSFSDDSQAKGSSAQNVIDELTQERDQLITETASLEKTVLDSKSVNSANLKDIKDKTYANAKINSDVVKSQQFGDTLFTGLQYANANNMIDFMFTDYWLKQWFNNKDISDFFNFDKHKESVCNPNNPVSIGGSAEGSVISCSGGSCLPVLTYASERTELEYPNGTIYNLYTTVYYISSADSRGKDLSYNIYFKNSKVTLDGFREDQVLNPFEVKYYRKVSKSSLVFDTICVKFNIPFPVDNDIQTKDEYCRDITTKIFDTGSPEIPLNASNIGTYNDYVNDAGNPINSNIDVAKIPGFLE